MYSGREGGLIEAALVVLGEPRKPDHKVPTGKSVKVGTGPPGHHIE